MKTEYRTEVGLLSVWNSDSFRSIDTLDQYTEIFVKDQNLLDAMNQGQLIIWGTGGDGSFPIEVRLNENAQLSPEEIAMVDRKSVGHKLIVTGRVCVGSPECVGTVESGCLEKKLCTEIIGLEPGTYEGQLYFLVDSEALALSDEMTPTDLIQYTKDHPDFDKTGYIITLQKVVDGHSFTPITKFPQLG